jgi:ankyrin repeat protein
VNYLKLKNNENKNLLYLAIHNHRNDIVDFILNKINITTLNSPHIYLHKSIKMRDPLLTTKMLLHVDPNYCDDEGNNAFHILFSSFYKNHTKCSLIGDKLLEYNCKPNFFNDNLMSPVHMAVKKGSRECLEWILMQNKNLLKEGKEVFDINIKVFNNCE